MRKLFVLRPILTTICLLLAGSAFSRAATVNWTNTVGGNWSAATNWSPNSIPASGDTVFITNAGTYAVAVDVSPTLAGLTIGSTNGGVVTVNLSSTTLTLNGPSFFDTNTAFNFSGGTLDGTGTANFAGQFNWSGGTLDSTTLGGKTVFTNSATVTITTGNTKTFQRRAVDNYTTTTWSAGQLNLSTGCVWNNKNGATFDLAGDLNAIFIGGSLPVFNNDGSLLKSAGAGAAAFQFYLNNANFTSCQSGDLNLGNGGTATGRYDATGSSAALNFNGGTHSLLGSVYFTGSGLFRITAPGGIVNVATPLLITNRFELANAGTLDGTNTVTFAGPFTWSGGTLDSTTLGGKTVFTNSATVTITTGNTKTFQRRAVDNYTTTWSAGQLNVGSGCVWNNKNGATFDLAGDLNAIFIGGANSAFNNFATLKNPAARAQVRFSLASPTRRPSDVRAVTSACPPAMCKLRERRNWPVEISPAPCSTSKAAC